MEDTLSKDELRMRLFNTFKNKGVLDKLKTQLRNQLIQELKYPVLNGAEPIPQAVPARSDPILISACNSIVADHLRICGYEYTLSIFYPECGQSNSKVTTEDLLQLVNISPESDLYQSLVSSIKDGKGFLTGLLKHLTRHHACTVYRDADTQTSCTASYGESLVEKLRSIDKEYENLSYSGDHSSSMESKLAAYRKDIEAKAQAEMNKKMQHFKDAELAKVRMEEKASFHKEFDRLKQELQRTYEMKAKALMDREKNSIDQLQKQREIEEKDMYMQRQSLLKEIDRSRERENELKIRMEAFERTCQMFEDKVKNTEELLRRRELAMKTMEATHDETLKTELSRYQMQLKEEFMKRTEKLAENETKIKVETARIQNESALIDSKLQEHCRMSSELKRLQKELDAAQQQVSLLNQQKGLLQERLGTMGDYSDLERDKRELNGQVQLLKNQLLEAQEQMRLLRADLTRPSKEELALQMELQRIQNAHRMNKEEYDGQNQALQEQLQREMEQSAQFKTQLMADQEKLQWLSSHVKDLKMQLSQTQQALENEVLRTSKPSLDHSFLSPDKLVFSAPSVDRTLLRGRAGFVDVEGGVPMRANQVWGSDLLDCDIDSVAEAKPWLQELQEEAETLEEAYGAYQQRAVHTTIPLIFPTRPHPSTAHPLHHTIKKNISQTRLSQKPKSSCVSESFQPATISSSALYDTMITVQTGQPRVTSEDLNELQTTVFNDYSTHRVPKSLQQTVQQPQEGSSSPPRQSSPKLHFGPRVDQEELSKGVVVPAVAGPEPLLPGSLADQDLSSEPSYIPELLLDTAVSLSEEAPVRPTVPHSPDPPEDPLDLEGQTEAAQTPGEATRGADEEAEEQKWLRERKEKQERRQQEQEEARERELQELKRLEEETLLQEVEEAGQKEAEETEISKGREEEDCSNEEGPKTENPLDKYMKIILEARKQQTESPVIETCSDQEDKDLSAKEDNSIEVYAPKDAIDDEDFW
ncbi:centriole and centriolar satellite protein ofd1 isoform X1 [Takifugu rubripes]|uniref:OFD1 centriole and centriolar satellite protein n=1 Tax=Takifugu rubripes TaxID=31033 RepID=A0A3B5KQK5_TAKRU|nr:oral-facial-digital syndrome 1 protein isoform X1 [Takifugu rubripes]